MKLNYILHCDHPRFATVTSVASSLIRAEATLVARLAMRNIPILFRQLYKSRTAYPGLQLHDRAYLATCAHAEQAQRHRIDGLYR